MAHLYNPSLFSAATLTSISKKITKCACGTTEDMVSQQEHPRFLIAKKIV
jgi:hypothetical protein